MNSAAGISGRNGTASRPEDIGRGDLPLLHRAAIVYLAAPFAVWMMGWLRPWAGIPATALLVAGLWQALSGSWRPASLPRPAAAAALAAAVWVATSPNGGFFLHELDWDTHRAVFLDMTRGGWPTYVADHFGEPKLLRYYLGWYMIPALAARAAGAAALDWAVPIWTWCGTGLAAMLVARGLHSVRGALLAVAIVFLFGGVDAADVVLSRGVDWLAGAAPPAMLPEYRSHPRGFYISPQHFIPAALASLLLIQLRNHRRLLAASGVVLATCLFWSAFVFLGLLPLFAALAAGRTRFRSMLGWRNLLAAGPLAGLAALYLSAGAVAFPRGWIWDAWDSHLHMAARLSVLYAAEFLVVAALVWRNNPGVVRDPLFVAVVAALLVAPLRYYGTATFDEWTRKAAMPCLLALSYFAATTVAIRWQRARGRSIAVHGLGARSKAPRPAAFWLLVATLAAGAAHWWTESKRLHFGPVSYGQTGESLITDLSWYPAFQRISESKPEFATALLRDNDEKPERRGELVVQSRYDVHLEQGNRLLYTRPNCDFEEEQASWFFLEVHYAADPGGRRPGRPPWNRWTARRTGEDSEFLVQRTNRRVHYAKDRGCTVVAWLRDDFVSFRTGQIAFGGRLVWEAEVRTRQ